MHQLIENYEAIHSFIHSGHFYSASSSPLLLRGSPDTARADTVSEFLAEAPQAIASEELPQGPYVAARAGVDPTTLRTIGVDSTNEPPRPTSYYILFYYSSATQQQRSNKTVASGIQ